MPALSEAATQQAAQTRYTGLEMDSRPAAEDLLPQGVQSQPTEQPTADDGELERDRCTQQGARPRRRIFMQRPGNQERPHRRFGTGDVLAANLVEPEELLHFF
jgi:hypothetical protein